MTSLSHANYLVVPRATSESWEYVPVCSTDKINAGNYWLILPETHLYQFGILSSAMHMSWIKCVSGKLQCYDRVHHSPTIKNFPWPLTHTQAHVRAIEAKTLALLQVRAQYLDVPLSALYHPASMPAALRNAHIELDKAVDAAYGQTGFASDDSRIGFLLHFQRKLASLLVTLTDDDVVMTAGSIDYNAVAARRAASAFANTVF